MNRPAIWIAKPAPGLLICCLNSTKSRVLHWCWLRMIMRSHPDAVERSGYTQGESLVDRSVKKMNRMFGFAVRSLIRDWKSGELTILGLALMIAVAGSTTTNLFSDRLNRTMELQAAAFLGADLVVTNHSSLPEAWMEHAKKLGLTSAKTADFASVIMHGDALLLCGVKAVSENYPLRGALKTSTGLPGDEIQTETYSCRGRSLGGASCLIFIGA